ncbi:hypothetical protein LWI29_010033 [Acer saccharum]|uniref:RIN4 pathogenic type III effector avirulence factor Avr cleavage site domain-containing protein n=1 Tax=Acer saccharum TaxID=4024 RepID=A0AA39S2Q9_ACESA|nr:hypothetical protein LWI29_010033 [Acer saccharum]
MWEAKLLPGLYMFSTVPVMRYYATNVIHNANCVVTSEHACVELHVAFIKILLFNKLLHFLYIWKLYFGTEDKGRPLPKFCEWDVNDTSSAEGFTVIFNKARNEKKTGGTKPDSPAKNESQYKHRAVLGNPQSFEPLTNVVQIECCEGLPPTLISVPAMERNALQNIYITQSVTFQVKGIKREENM